jgi:uncharacterized membrane protein YphA (DoxX/SURF4 family)
LLRGLLVAMFLTTGISKVAAIPPSPENFARWGLPLSVMYAVGAMEIVGAVGLLIPRVAPFAALVLMATMVGALRTGLVYREMLHIILPIALLGLLALSLFVEHGRKPRPKA